MYNDTEHGITKKPMIEDVSTLQFDDRVKKEDCCKIEAHPLPKRERSLDPSE
jgi:hypothetical protein